MFCCASTSSVRVSKSMGPLRNVLPSGDTARVGEITGTVRLPRTMEDATSKTNTVRVAACKLTPTISLPERSGGGFRLFHRVRHLASRHRNVILGQDGLCLILVN